MYIFMCNNCGTIKLFTSGEHNSLREIINQADTFIGKWIDKDTTAPMVPDFLNLSIHCCEAPKYRSMIL